MATLRLLTVILSRLADRLTPPPFLFVVGAVKVMRAFSRVGVIPVASALCCEYGMMQ